MIDMLWTAGLTNALTATLLAAIVYGVTRLWRNEYLARVLWLLVLAKFMFPPLVAITVSRSDIPWPAELPPATAPLAEANISPPAATPETQPSVATQQLPIHDSQSHRAASAPVPGRPGAWMPSLKTIGMITWLLGMLFFAARLLLRTVRFDRLVNRACRAPTHLQQLAVAQSEFLGLRRCPEIRLIAAAASPATWAAWRRPVILLPVALVETLSREQLESVLAHELAHIHRRDHWTRWLESLVLVVYWWHPVARWTCQALRRAEELCCDAWVMRRAGSDSQSYAEALVAAVALVAQSSGSSPELAVTFSQRTFTKRRLHMILDQQYSSRLSKWICLVLVLLAMVVLPLSTFAVEDPIAPKPAPRDQGVAVEVEAVGLQSHNPLKVEFSPDGQWLAGGCADGHLRIWKVSDHRVQHNIDTHEQRINAIRYSPLGKSIQVAGKSLTTWDAANGELLKTVKLDLDKAGSRVEAYAFSTKGDRLVTKVGNKGSEVAIWDTTSGELLQRIEVGGVHGDAAFSPDGTLLAVGTIYLQNSVGSVHLFDANTGKQIRTIDGQKNSISSVNFSPDGKFVAGGDHRRVRMWNVATGELYRTFEGHSGPSESIAFSRDGKLIASGAEGPYLRSPRQTVLLSEVKLWEVESGRLLKSLAGQQGRTFGLAFSPDSTWLAQSDDTSLICNELHGLHSWIILFEHTSIDAPPAR